MRAAWAWAASETDQQDVSSTVSLVIEWAVTPYRSGPYRVLVAVGLLDLLRSKTAAVSNRYGYGSGRAQQYHDSAVVRVSYPPIARNMCSFFSSSLSFCSNKHYADYPIFFFF
jgi:hypothetical protein